MDNLWAIQCKNCGAPVGYDIEAQTYRCPNCGRMPDSSEIRRQVPSWKRICPEDRNVMRSDREMFSCPNCGAELLFAEGEESETCDFCGSNLIRGEFADSASFPELLVPFVLTQEEAARRLQDWAADPKNRQTPEAKYLMDGEFHLVGYYLPYQLVRGPVSGRILRQQAWREYHCRGYVEGALVSTCRAMDNAVLDAAEPFDLGDAVPFSYGYVAGHRLRLPDLSPAKVRRRTMKEAERAFLPDVQKVLHTDGVRVRMESDDLMQIPLLLPVYLLQSRNLTAVVNGQTGRVAVTSDREEGLSELWKLEPAILTLLLTLVFGVYIHFYWPGMLMFAAICGLILGTGYRNGRMSLTRRIISQGCISRASRRGGALTVTEGEPVLQNPLPNDPVFTESKDGRGVPVRIRFYTPGRILGLLVRCGAIIALPDLAAVLICLIRDRSPGTIHPQYGAAWYVLAGVFVLLYWIMEIRQDVYNHPLIYESGRHSRPMGSRTDRALTIRSMLGVDRGNMLPWKSLHRDEKRLVLILAGSAGCILIGCIAAILSEGGI